MTYNNDEEEIVRKPLSSLAEQEICSLIDGPNNCVYLCDKHGKAFALVRRDGIFDAEGNYFEDDV